MSEGSLESTKGLTIGHWIAAQRRGCGKTQQELADVIGCERTHISRIENDKEKPSKQLAEGMAVHLKIPPEHVSDFVRLVRRLPAQTQLPLPKPVEAALPQFTAAAASEQQAQAWIICIPVTAAPDPSRLLNAFATALQLYSGEHGEDFSMIAS